MNRKELKSKVLDILEKHYHGRNFIEDRASEDILDFFQELLVCDCTHFTECKNLTNCKQK
jgi:hypothetical protein